MEARTELIARPAGTVTFLFTDVEGGLAGRKRDAAALDAARHRHDQIVRDAIAAHQGLVFKTVGDAFCAVFARAEDALAAAVNLQRAIAREDFSAIGGLFVCAALHTGTADERDDDYFGPSVNEVARIVALAHGEQTLVSETTYALISAALPPDVRLRDLGEHKLKDIARPERVFQVVADGLRSEFPALRSADAARSGNLPVPFTSFVGRTGELAEIGELLEQSRLVTITGMGGVGKTRLALEAARAFAERFPDGTWCVELARITDPALASARVGDVFGMREQVGTAMNDTWIAALDQKRALLLLDNCEHVITAIATVAHRILERCPGISILATSREPLHIGGEHVMRLAPLGLPATAPGALPSIAELHAAPAVRLFLERATSERAGTLHEDETALRSLVSICTRLDGIPLAIELAAARAHVLGLRGLAQRLDDRFRLLAGGPRSVMPRQQTLRALLDWSHDLLSDAEQRVFRRLAVFAGGWTLEAAQTVCVDPPESTADRPITDWDVFESISSLVDKSLVVVDANAPETRYSFLETTRAYALECLADSPDAGRFDAPHARYALALAEASKRWCQTGSPSGWQTTFERDLDNIRAALGWALIAKRDVILGATIVQKLSFALEALGFYFEGLDWAEKALAALRPGLVPSLEGALCIVVARNHSYIGSPPGCVAAADRAVHIYRALNKPTMLAFALAFKGFGLYYLDRREEGDVCTTEALALARATGDPSLIAWVLCTKSWTVPPDDFALRRELLAESIALLNALPGRLHVELALQAMSEVEFAAGDYERSMAYAREGGAPERRSGPSEGLATSCLVASAAAAFALRRFDIAREDAREALAYGRERGTGRFLGTSIGLLAGVAATSGRASEAARLLGASEAQFIAIGRVRMAQEQFVNDRTRELLGEQLAPDEFARLLAEGRAWSTEQAVEAALSV
jgi:predicted ATPase/class 3 adenylate cyclase